MTKFIPGGPERYAHQKRGLNRLIETGGKCALLFDPGTGKTATALDYASLLTLKGPGETRVLVVAPLVAVDTWVDQAKKWVSPQVNFWAEALGGSLLHRAEALAARGGQPHHKPLVERSPRVKPHHPRALHHERSLAWSYRTTREVPVTPGEGPDAVAEPRLVITVINIDTLVRRDQVGRKTMADIMVDAILRYSPELLIVDESHKIKGVSTNASRLLSRVEQHVPRRVLLTGTVMPSGPMDVFGQWRFMEPYAFGDVQPDGSRKRATFGGFRARYAVEGGWMGKEIIGYRNLDEMQKIMALNSSVARKKDALDLPPTTDTEVGVDLSAAEKKAYSQMRDQLAADLTGGALASAPNKLTQMLRLRQITSGHLPDDTGSVQNIGLSKARTIASLVHDTLVGEKRIVVFALFTKEIRDLERVLAKAGTEVMVISGATSQQDRMRMRRRFGSDDPQRMVMVAQIKTMSLAVNELVTASHAIFASMSQQRDDYIQARDRLDRIGQTRPVTFWHAVAHGTVDEVILKSHREKTDLEDAMLHHIAGSPGNV